LSVLLKARRRALASDSVGTSYKQGRVATLFPKSFGFLTRHRERALHDLPPPDKPSLLAAPPIYLDPGGTRRFFFHENKVFFFLDRVPDQNPANGTAPASRDSSLPMDDFNCQAAAGNGQARANQDINLFLIGVFGKAPRKNHPSARGFLGPTSSKIPSKSPPGSPLNFTCILGPAIPPQQRFLLFSCPSSLLRNLGNTYLNSNEFDRVKENSSHFHPKQDGFSGGV